MLRCQRTNLVRLPDPAHAIAGRDLVRIQSDVSNFADNTGRKPPRGSETTNLLRVLPRGPIFISSGGLASVLVVRRYHGPMTCRRRRSSDSRKRCRPCSVPAGVLFDQSPFGGREDVLGFGSEIAFEKTLQLLGPTCSLTSRT